MLTRIVGLLFYFLQYSFTIIQYIYILYVIQLSDRVYNVYILLTFYKQKYKFGLHLYFEENHHI
jgi:hypothetical protein